MELKEAKKVVINLREWLDEGLYNDRDKALITFDNRITELEAEMKQILNEFDEVEAQRDEVVEMLIYWIKDKRHITIKSLEAIKLICSVTGKTWEEIKQPGVAG